MTFRSDHRGFSLVELVAVLFIIALAAGVVSVSIGRSRGKAEMRAEVARIQSLLRQARQTSLVERVPVSFALLPGSGKYGLLRGGKPLGERFSPAMGIEAASEGDITFFPRGDSTGGRIYLGRGGRHSHLIEVDSVTGTSKLTRL